MNQASFTFHIIGIDASTWGLEAFGELLTELTNNTGRAFIFLQHLDPMHERMLASILNKYTKRTVREVTDCVLLHKKNYYPLLI